MKETILETVANVLKSNQKYIAEDGELLKAKVYADIMTMEPKLLRLLLSNEDIKATFFSNKTSTRIIRRRSFY
jgi:adenine-specific DNA-methyltransferase